MWWRQCWMANQSHVGRRKRREEIKNKKRREQQGSPSVSQHRNERLIGNIWRHVCVCRPHICVSDCNLGFFFSRDFGFLLSLWAKMNDVFYFMPVFFSGLIKKNKYLTPKTNTGINSKWRNKHLKQWQRCNHSGLSFYSHVPIRKPLSCPRSSVRESACLHDLLMCVGVCVCVLICLNLHDLLRLETDLKSNVLTTRRYMRNPLHLLLFRLSLAIFIFWISSRSSSGVIRKEDCARIESPEPCCLSLLKPGTCITTTATWRPSL